MQAVKRLGPVPGDARCSGALQALRAAGSSYEEPIAGVGDVVPMVIDHMSLPSGKVAGVSLREQVGDDLKDMVQDFEDHMLQDASVWTSVEDQAKQLTPYNDPLLKQRSGYLSFLKKLYDCGVLCFSVRCRGRVGAFCVSKKPKVVDGVVTQRQRLVLDCRAVNLQFKDPPRTHLGSLASVAEAVIPQGEKLYVATADIRDFFYACHLPPGMEEFFGLHSDVSFEEARIISGGAISEDALGWNRIVPCISVLPMGFNWSFYLVQALHEFAALKAIGGDKRSLFLDCAPAPPLSSSSCSTMPYCDNVHVLSLSSQLCQSGKEIVCRSLEDMGFVLHEHTSSSCITQTLGGVIDGDVGEVRCTSKRIWSLILAFEYLTTHVASRELVQRLLGHAMVACVINRGGMGVFRRLYDYVHSDSEPRRLSPLEVRECHIFIGLLPLLTADLRRPWNSTVTCSDASPQGWGVTERELPVEQVASIAAWQERWRFKRLGPEEWRERALGRDPFSDPLTVVGIPKSDDIEDTYVQDPLFPEVPPSILNPTSWHTVSMGRWKHNDEHITLKEARSLLIAVRRLSRARKNRFSRHLILLDNMALCFAVNKGRSSNYGMLRVLQQIGSICLAAGITLRPRWVPSELNVSDNPSRGTIAPGAHIEQPKQAGAKDSGEDSGPSWANEIQFFPEKFGSSDESFDRKESECEEYESSESKGTENERQNFRHENCPPAQASELGVRGSVRQEEEDINFGRQEHQLRGEVPVPGLLQQVHGLLPGERCRQEADQMRRLRRLPHRLHGRAFPQQQVSSRRREDTGSRGISQHRGKGEVSACSSGIAGVEEDSSSTEQVTSPQSDDVWDGYGTRLHGQVGHGTEGGDRLHSVSSSWRRNRPEGKKYHCPSESSGSPIQVDHSGDQGPGRSQARQSGRVRQQHSHRPGPTCMDWRRTAQESEGSQQQGRTDQSVRRYTKIGRVQQLLNKLTVNRMNFCKWSEKNLAKVFLGTMSARSATAY
eukprot:Skav229623  [mRNA]  locus=scaffold1753:167277:170273:- [translate_table: standard]